MKIGDKEFDLEALEKEKEQREANLKYEYEQLINDMSEESFDAMHYQAAEVLKLFDNNNISHLFSTISKEFTINEIYALFVLYYKDSADLDGLRDEILARLIDIHKPAEERLEELKEVTFEDDKDMYFVIEEIRQKRSNSSTPT